MNTKEKQMTDLSISLFCRDMGMMLAAGTLPEEAVTLLEEDAGGNADFADALHRISAGMQENKTFAAAARDVLPEHAANMLAAGEKSGRVEQVLDRLADYYERRDGMQQRLRSALLYPLILLFMMSIILAFLVWKVVPVFAGVYRSLAGSLAGSSYAYVAVSRILSCAALAVTLVICVLLLVGMGMASTEAGRKRLAAFLEKFPLTAEASRQLAISRMADTLALFTASGIDPDTAMQEACHDVHHAGLHAAAEKCCREMADGAGLAQAVCKEHIFQPLYGRMLQSGSHSGKLDTTLVRLASMTGRDAENAIYGLIESIEPLLTSFLTLAVGITLLAAMLPLIGILGSIG